MTEKVILTNKKTKIMPWGAIAGLVGGLVGNSQIKQQNLQSQLFSKQMYEQQFADNVRLWNMQNEYNSPQEQIKRLQAAGLNKALIYGGSSGSASGNANQAQGASAMGANFQPANDVVEKGLKSIMDIHNVKQTKATTNNLEKQNEVLAAEALKRRAEAKLAETEANAADFRHHWDGNDNYAQPMAKVLREVEKHNKGVEFTQAQIEKLQEDKRAAKIINDANEALGPNARFVLNLIRQLLGR